MAAVFATVTTAATVPSICIPHTTGVTAYMQHIYIYTYACMDIMHISWHYIQALVGQKHYKKVPGSRHPFVHPGHSRNKIIEFVLLEPGVLLYVAMTGGFSILSLHNFSEDPKIFLGSLISYAGPPSEKKTHCVSAHDTTDPGADAVTTPKIRRDLAVPHQKYDGLVGFW